MSISGCGTAINVYPDDGEDESDAEPEGCDASTNTWGDEVLFVCTERLSVTEAVVGRIVVGNFTFLNYHSVWTHVENVCLRSIGPNTLADGVNEVIIDVTNWTLEPIAVTAPWPADGRICVDLPMTIGAASIETLTVSIQTSGASSANRQFQFEITANSDVTVNADVSEPVVGDFPIRSDAVTILGN
ncbi:hypothetical protein KBC59_00155 [Patescibacteria group bacterium]|nr:hypothetical protein [Patescibacteria group bacterium]